MTRFSRLMVCAIVLFPPLSSAGAAVPDTAALFEAKTVTERDSALAALEAAAPGDPAAAYAAGAGEFFTALEILAGGLHRHGFESPQSFMLPLMRLPVPDNLDPEPLTYGQFRAILVAFRDRLEKSAATLGSVPAEADIGMVIDLARLGIDLNEDGQIAPDESAAAIMASLSRGGGVPDGGRTRPHLPLRPRRRLLAAGLCRVPDGAGRLLAGA
ncbi:hypothetical protein NMG46_19470 [Mesorhizobium sp. LMG 17147]|uniref:hypothetical protein n=1 Tax=Mesorhizobium sp. LMG 17147 TaxID=2963091 RepID=UPI0020C93FCF|nr:hypothetical protein [Mesorhizobium sp. LMG 17147]MCP9232419.1 hypothetical protein [Mesorhizobium sp. LMG 17147]